MISWIKKNIMARRTLTMSVLAVLLAMISFLPLAASANTPVAELAPLAQTVAPDENVAIALSVSGSEVTAYAGIQATVTYDAEKFKYESASPVSGDVVKVWVSVTDDGQGKLTVTRYGAVGVKSGETAVMLTFKALAEGDELEFAVDGVYIAPKDGGDSSGREVSAAQCAVTVKKAPVWSGGGSGSEQDPYVISTAEDMRALASAVNGGETFAGEYFLLTKSLDLGDWSGIGNYADKRAFQGTFDGGGNTLTLTLNIIARKDGWGLFGYARDGKIRNVTVRGAMQADLSKFGGGIVGCADNLTVINCTNYADITGSLQTGGIVGAYEHTLTVESCENYGKITGNGRLAKDGHTAGIVGGFNYLLSEGPEIDIGLTVKNCVNRGNIADPWSKAGGIVGAVRGAVEIIGCENYGDVAVSGGSYAGGIVAENYFSDTRAGTLKINNCTNYGGVSARNGVGGIIGAFREGTGTVARRKSIEITGCSNSGRLYGESFTGGIIGGLGFNDPSSSGGVIPAVIRDVYNTGLIVEKTYEQTETSLGGIVGHVSRAELTLVNAYNTGEVAAVSEDGVGALIGAKATHRLIAPTVSFENCYYLPQYRENDLGEPEARYAVGSDTEPAEGTYLVAPAELLELAEALGAEWADDIGINDGYPILVWQTNKTVCGITTTLSAPAQANARLTINNRARADGELVSAAESGTVKYALAVAKQYELTGWTVNGGPVTYTSTTEGADTTYEATLSVTGDLNVAITIVKIAEDTSKGGPDAPDRNTATTVPRGYRWDGVTVDLTWFDPAAYDRTETYRIESSAELMGVAALVNGLVNVNCEVYLWDGTKQTAAEWNNSEYVLNADGSSGSNNQSTNNYHYGKYNFNGKTVLLTADIDMGATYSYGSWYGPNYMPLGGQYLMTDEDTRTKLSSSFCGTFDGGGHYVYNIYCDRHSSGNFGDGTSVGLIGRLGVHDSDPAELRPRSPTVRDVAVTGYIRANRSVGGIVGKIGQTADRYAIIENCANFATVRNTDAKGVGGIVGSAWNGGVIRNCYNAGDISSTYPSCPVGGIAGSNEIRIENCYSTGKISSPSDSFAMGIGTNNSSAFGSTHVINSYYLTENSPYGGYYDDKSVYDRRTNGLIAQYMTSDAFVQDLNKNNPNAYLSDSNGINNEYPVLSWQGGRTVPPEDKEDEPPEEDEKNETLAPGTTTVEDDSATTIVDELIPLADDPTLVVINVDTDGATVSSITAEVTAENVKAIADNGSSIEVRSDLGSVRLPNAAITDLAGKSDEKIDVKLTKDSADTYTLALTADDKPVATVDGGIKLTLPAENANSGTVAVLVREDGTEEVIKKSFSQDGKVSVPLDGSATVKLVDNAKAFADVGSGSWYNDAVRFASSHELLTGTSADNFSPEASMTRGMLVTVLYRLENEPSATGDLFADIASDAYYANAVLWAAANDIVNGTGAGKFSPDTAITREQLATMLHRYHQFSILNSQLSIAADLSAFPDAGSVSAWAEDAVIWAVGIGLIQGRDGALAPQGTATRAEVATVLRRFIEQL